MPGPVKALVQHQVGQLPVASPPSLRLSRAEVTALLARAARALAGVVEVGQLPAEALALAGVVEVGQV